MVKKDEKEQEDMDSNEAKEIDSTEEEDKNTKQESGIGKDGAKKSEDNNEKMDSTENNGKLVMLTASDFYMSHFSIPSSIFCMHLLKLCFLSICYFFGTCYA